MSRLTRLTPTAIVDAVTEASEQRRLARREAERQARELAETAARHAQVAATVNRPLLRAITTWTEPETLAHRPRPVRAQLTGIAGDVQKMMRTPGAAAITSGERSWAEAVPKLVDELLRCAELARAEAPDLTLDITTVLLAARPASRASWRQRALAAEELGDLPTAVRAHQAYLNLTRGDRLGVRERLRRLEDLDDLRLRLATALDTALRAGAPLPGTAADLRDLLLEPTPGPVRDEAVAGLAAAMTRMPVTDLTSPLTQDVLHLAVRWRREVALVPPPLDEDPARDLTVLRLNDLRQRLTGSRVCLVSPHTPRLHGSGLGGRVEDYDVVVRFGPPRNTARDAGTRTDLQVIRHDAIDGWNAQAWLRMILADEPRDWVTAVRGRLVPGRQHAVAEKSLHRPVEIPGDTPDEEPRDAYQLIRLLDVLAVCDTVDLFGFRPEEDFAAAELAWLTPRLEQLDEYAIGVR
ncbi:hypothetical protein KIH74_19120 [Kineosporia sp. J2-2]|uniref:Uncharacterized protein n=1 Tax=Kineosporia corallincola TaxID=2835133 RepID=A0ABS5TL20_9ACTN|nr:hypothetical protein [Kineosporia corallincola]MBT0771059.1 hypothetical protein [Kineosporia corallincola]